MGRIGIADNLTFLQADALSGTISFLPARLCTVDFLSGMPDDRHSLAARDCISTSNLAAWEKSLGRLRGIYRLPLMEACCRLSCSILSKPASNASCSEA